MPAFPSEIHKRQLAARRAADAARYLYRAADALVPGGDSTDASRLNDPWSFETERQERVRALASELMAHVKEQVK